MGQEGVPKPKSKGCPKSPVEKGLWGTIGNTARQKRGKSKTAAPGGTAVWFAPGAAPDRLESGAGRTSSYCDGCGGWRRPWRLR